MPRILAKVVLVALLSAVPVTDGCSSGDDGAAALEEAVSDPGGGEDVFAVTERAAQLSEQAAALSEANPVQAARITEWVNQLTVAPEAGG